MVARSAVSIIQRSYTVPKTNLIYQRQTILVDSDGCNRKPLFNTQDLLGTQDKNIKFNQRTRQDEEREFAHHNLPPLK